MRRKERPGAGRNPAGSSQVPNDNEGAYNANREGKLGVVVVEVGRSAQPSAFEQEFVEKVLSRLPGLPKPRIMVVLSNNKLSVEWAAQRYANEQGEPMAFVDMQGQPLAYRIPN
jgi:hypothetical protein